MSTLCEDQGGLELWCVLPGLMVKEACPAVQTNHVARWSQPRGADCGLGWGSGLGVGVLCCKMRQPPCAESTVSPNQCTGVVVCLPIDLF